jgi:hypothetical protein
VINAESDPIDFLGRLCLVAALPLERCLMASSLGPYTSLTAAIWQLPTLSAALSKSLYGRQRQLRRCVAYRSRQGFEWMQERLAHGHSGNYGDLVELQSALLRQFGSNRKVNTNRSPDP